MDKDLVRKIMDDLKYESVFQSMNFSLFQSPLKEFGEIENYILDLFRKNKNE